MSSFYKDGLNFTCQRCSGCCRHEPGYVFLSRKDLEDMVNLLEMKEEEFLKVYCRIVDLDGMNPRISLKEKANNDCIFWKEEGCEIYKARPLQCRSYPFWHTQLASREVWDSLQEDCPGINKGTLHSQEEIDSWLKMRDEEPLIRAVIHPKNKFNNGDK